MGASMKPVFLSFDGHLKGMNQENKGVCTKTSNGTTTDQAKYSKKRRQVMRRSQRSKRLKNFLERSRSSSGMNGKVRTLKKLVPNGKSMGLDGLFRETADYILGLEMQVKVMQILVEALNHGGSKE